MTKEKSIELYSNLQKLGNLTGSKFVYALTKNQGLLKFEIDTISESIKKELEPTDEEYKKYDNKRIELAELLAKKDDKGNAIKIKKIENGQKIEVFDGLENNPEWDVAFEGLKETYKEVLNKRDEIVKEQNEFLKTESTVQLYKVSLSDIPKDISKTQMDMIVDMIVDDIPSPFPIK
jgi:vacuolar-type H+-ATPase subunit I/STV1